MCLRLVAPEYNAKPWNKNKPFLQFFEDNAWQEEGVGTILNEVNEGEDEEQVR